MNFGRLVANAYTPWLLSARVFLPWLVVAVTLRALPGCTPKMY
jgi:hypothetical protein